jgi:hypothetical protein
MSLTRMATPRIKTNGDQPRQKKDKHQLKTSKIKLNRQRNQDPQFRMKSFLIIHFLATTYTCHNRTSSDLIDG